MSPNPNWYMDRWTTQRLIKELGDLDCSYHHRKNELAMLTANRADPNVINLKRSEIDDIEAKCAAIIAITRKRLPDLSELAEKG